MLVFLERSDKALAAAWDGPVVALAAPRLKAYAKRHAPAFEVIALPQVLAESEASVAELLGAAFRLLTPGGVVVGHVDHLFTLGRVTRPSGLLRWALSASGRGGMGTPGRCLRELARAGFVLPECYYIYPGIESPMSLMPCRQGAEWRQFVRAIRRAPNMYSELGYRLRLAAVSLGFGALQPPQLFFWACRPC